MKNFKASILILSSLCICNIIIANTDSNVYIAYLGEKKYDDHQQTIDSHHDLLATVVGSKEQASKLFIHNYKHGFSGFSAKLTRDQARKLSALPGVIRVFQDQVYKTQGNLIASEYYGLTSTSFDNIAQRTNQGEDVIIGIIDTGIWANNTRGVFSDEGYGPIPARWNGTCKDDKDFIASQQCNKKVIGAYWFREGATAAGFRPNDSVENEITSPLDFQGHGTHCASTAAGSPVSNVTLLNNNYGNFRGVAPKARLAIYKACYNIKKANNIPKTDDCLTSDVYAAFDKAIDDGVDVISASIGPQHAHGDDLDNYLNFASLHAVLKGIPVVTAAGNMGPHYTTMGNTSPWHITVAATRVNAEIAAPIKMGNGTSVSSVPLSGVAELGTRKIVTLSNTVLQGWNFPSNNKTLAEMVHGNFVFLPEYSKRNGAIDKETVDARNLFNSAKRLGAVALIIAVAPTNTITYMFQQYTESVYCVDQDAKKQLLDYIGSTVNPMVNIGKPVIREGQSVRTLVESYSSRGPSLQTPAILKPDIAAPAWGLLGAASGVQKGQATPSDGFKTMKGTSSATPVVAGLVALLRAEHRDWSPAAIKSALVTSASKLDIYGAPILSPWSKDGLAGPLDLGGGIANVQAATDPGLIYDMQPSDYSDYLCGHYHISLIEHMRHITWNPSLSCLGPKKPIMDVNLPSIGVENLRNMTMFVIRRTVTNVGPEISTYRPLIQAPLGTKITIKPKKLKFTALRKQINYKLTIEKIHAFDNNTAGALTWSDGKHFVTSPIVVLY